MITLQEERKKTVVDLFDYFGQIAKDLSQITSMTRTIDLVSQHMQNIFGSDNSSIILKRGKRLKFISVIGVGSEKLAGYEFSADKGIAGWIVENGSSLIVKDVNKDPRFNKDIDRISGFQTRSIIGVPLKTSNQIFGVIELINRLDKKSFTELDLKILETLGELTALAIERLYYYHSTMKYYATEPVTGLFSRKAFFRQFEIEKRKCRNLQSRLSILSIRFEQKEKKLCFTNRDYRDIAKILLRLKPERSMVYFYNENNFLLTLPETNQGNLELFRRQLEKELSQLDAIKNAGIKINLQYRVLCSDNMKDILASMSIEKQMDNESQEVEVFSSEADHLSGTIEQMLADDS